MKNNELLSKLHTLINALEDSSTGYRHLGKYLENDELKTIMNRLSQQRKLFLEEIVQDARDMGENLKAESTVKGYFHRTWMEIKATVSTSEDESRIEEAISGEKYLLEHYDNLLKISEMPDYINERLTDQRKMILGAIGQLEEFNRSLV